MVSLMIQLAFLDNIVCDNTVLIYSNKPIHRVLNYYTYDYGDLYIASKTLSVSPYPRSDSLRSEANVLPGIKVIDKVWSGSRHPKKFFTLLRPLSQPTVVGTLSYASQKRCCRRLHPGGSVSLASFYGAATADKVFVIEVPILVSPCLVV